MNQPLKTSFRIGALILAALFAGSPALADKPSWAGGGKEGKHGKGHDEERYDEHRGSVEFRLDDRNRRIVYDYYGSQFRSGNCPPGLAKKHNGCLPPGQAKKWAMGRPLPGDVVRYDLPPELLMRLPIPPSGQRYVRVATDILLIAAGTGMVMDAIEDIGR